jgi:hypothetical protein
MSLSEDTEPLTIVSVYGHIRHMPSLVWMWDITMVYSNGRSVKTCKCLLTV